MVDQFIELGDRLANLTLADAKVLLTWVKQDGLERLKPHLMKFLHGKGANTHTSHSNSNVHSTSIPHSKKTDGEAKHPPRSILLTEPHGYCTPEILAHLDTAHECDETAPRAGTIIYNEFVKAPVTDVALVRAPTRRPDCDLNRPMSRSTKFQKWIDQFMTLHCNDEERALCTAWELDIHSFPPHTQSYHTKNEPHDFDYDVVILDMNPNEEKYDQFNIDLAHIVEEAGSNVGLLKGSYINEITQRVHLRYTNNVSLIEFNEELSDAAITQVAQRLVALVIKYTEAEEERLRTNPPHHCDAGSVIVQEWHAPNV